MITENYRRLQRYGKGSGRLAKSIAEFMQGPSLSQLGLYEELALARTLLNDVATMYEAATTIEGSNTPELAMKAMIGMQGIVRDALDAVRTLARSTADIESSLSIQPIMVASLASSLQTCIVKLCGADTVLLNEFEHELSSLFTMIRRPEDNAEILSPYETIKQMDALIPVAEYNPTEIAKAKADDTPKEEVTWTTLEDLDKTHEDFE